VRRSRRRRLLRAVLLAGLTLYFLAGAAFLMLRYAVLPHVDGWREDIAAQASEAVGLPVSIGRIEADWSGLRPRLHLRQLVVSDADGAAALTLERVDATFAWTSLVKLRPYFHRLEIFRPELHIARDVNGVITVAGIAVGEGSDDGAGLAWLLEQRQFLIRNATLSWQDALRAAPPLVMSDVNLRVQKHFGRHAIGFTARPASGLAQHLDLRADLVFGDHARLSDISGQFYAALDGLSVAALAPWGDLPLKLAGDGDVALWANVDAGRVVRVSTTADLADAQLQLGDDLPMLQLRRIQGHVSGERTADKVAVATRGLTLDTVNGVHLAPTDLQVSIQSTPSARAGAVRANQLDLAVLAALAAHLPFDAAERKQLAAMAPRGTLTDVDVRWESDGEHLRGWSLNSGFQNLGLAPHGGIPGLRGISGTVAGDQDSGRYTLRGEQVVVELPTIFTDALGFDRLNAEGGWRRVVEGMRVNLDSASFANADLTGDAAGNYILTPEGPGEIDLQARLEQASGSAVWRYLPKVVNDDTREWLRRGIVSGTAHDARLRLKGDLGHFPFTDGSGVFLITARVNNAVLDFAPGWPNIDRIEGGLRFDGPRMTITASQGRISGTNLKDVVADLPDLSNGDEQMTITGQAVGATADFLQFIADSPVRERIDGFTDDMVATGKGALDLRLDMPLRHVVDTAVTGKYRFDGNTLRIAPHLPLISAAAGRVEFTAESLTIPGASGTALDGPVSLSARTDKDGTVRFEANGEAYASAIRREYDVPLLEHLSGRTPWQLQATMQKGRSSVSVNSGLSGISSSLPQPFNKSANDAMPLAVTVNFPAGAPVQVEGSLGDVAAAALTVAKVPGSAPALSGGIGVGVKPRMATEGIMVAWQQADIDLDAWWRALGHGATDGAGTDALPLAGVAVEADTLRLRGQQFHDLKLRARQKGRSWDAEIRSREAEGTVSWDPAGSGRVTARLGRLMLAKAKKGDPATQENAGADSGDTVSSLPALDVIAERFGVRGLDLGRLQLQAVNRNGDWHLNDLSITNESSTFKGSGIWSLRPPATTTLDFELTASDVGKLLKRLDYPDAVRGGTATLGGHLGWRGGPADLDIPSLNGAMTLLAESGQFQKLDPGVGRLLGVLSLQSLPRRITLDFRDVFSEGFAFDRISGSIDVKAGVLHTDPLEIRGPAARIFMRGQASVPDETQDLEVTVQPTLSESVAVGAALGGAVVNPVAGVVTYIVQKALEDPVEKLFAFEYSVTGTWDDPVVEKVGKRKLPAPTEVKVPLAPRTEER
jgi:uncharacterized protein (TIGR02099 family)